MPATVKVQCRAWGFGCRAAGGSLPLGLGFGGLRGLQFRVWRLLRFSLLTQRSSIILKGLRLGFRVAAAEVSETHPPQQKKWHSTLHLEH